MHKHLFVISDLPRHACLLFLSEIYEEKKKVAPEFPPESTFREKGEAFLNIKTCVTMLVFKPLEGMRSNAVNHK